MDCNSCPLQEECETTKERAVEEIGSKEATHWISSELQGYCPLKSGHGLGMIKDVAWALELKTYLDKGIVAKLEGEVVLDAAKKSDRAMIMREIGRLLNKADFENKENAE